MLQILSYKFFMLKFFIVQILHVTNSTCYKFFMLHILHVTNFTL